MVCREMDENSKFVVLSNIFDSVALKDIVMRNKVASPVALEKVLAACTYIFSSPRVAMKSTSLL